MAIVLQSEFVLIRLEASCQADCILENDEQTPPTSGLGSPLRLGAAGRVLEMHGKIQTFHVGDLVLACLSDQNISTDAHGQRVASVHQSLVCKLPAGVSESDGARVPMAFAISLAVLHNTGIVSLPFQAAVEQQHLPPRNVLLVSNNIVVSLMIIKLLRMYIVVTVFIIYEAETTPGTTGEEFSIDPAMIAGAHFAQRLSSATDLWEVARGLRSNLGHYGPYSGTGCFDLALDMTGKADTPEPYRRLLCPETGRLFQLPQTMYIDLNWLFVESGIMTELEILLKEGDIKTENLYVLFHFQSSKTHKSQNIHAENNRSRTVM